MKQRYIFILLTVLSAVFACTRVDEGQLVPQEPVQEKVQMTFTAVIDDADNTKTLLEGALGDGFRNVLWQPGDAIGISSDIEHMGLGSVEKFVANTEIAALSTEFDGFISMSSKYKAFYPYSETLKDSSSYFIFTLPTEQMYVKNSFDPAAAPMVAVADYGETLKFRNLCGVLALQLTGEETVNSIVFSGFDEAGNLVKVSGEFEVDPHQDSLSIKPLPKSYSSVKMTCETPVKLDPTTPTAFPMVLPAGTYTKFTVMIVTEEGVMYKEATKPLTIKRSEVQPTAALMYVESEYIDLSAVGTANSYIIDKGAGLYSFDATVIGNGVYGFIDGVEFHTDSPYIQPADAKCLWEDRVGVINNVDFDGERVIVATTGKEGNALIAVTDNNGEILWSWHIWVTDKPQDQTYVNSTGEYVMQDRNLGAIRADRGADNDFYDAHGLLYQWGRKDPFAIELSDIASGGYHPLFFMTASSTTLTESIKYPKNMNVVYNDTWESARVDSLWSSTQKTIYDPCPAGYTIPLQDVWSGLSFEGNDPMLSYAQWYPGVGAEFYYDGVNATFYPLTGYVNHYASLYFIPNVIEDYRSFMWSSMDDTYVENNPSYAYGFTYQTYPSGSEWVSVDYYREKSEAHAVRCMKDAGYEATCMPMVKITVEDKFADSASVEGKISTQGLSAVTECGFVWGTSADITLENASYQKVNADDFSYTITGLESATRYFVRAYAINKYGIAYSDVISFYTDWEEDTASNLSINGTSNCYLIPPMLAAYSINADVIGNGAAGILNDAGFHTSNPSITPKDVKLLWQDKEDVVYNVGYTNGKAYFLVTGTEGNAVIAARDVNDNIIWSWHIWVTDDPAEQIYNTNEGKTFSVMDRNLGSISAVMGENGGSLYYQWGRKDPFRLNEMYELVKINTNPFSYMSEAIAAPTTHPTGGDYWVLNHSPQFWSKSVKTIYDPCPVGWKVPGSEIWSGMRKLIDCDGQDHYAYAYGVVFGFADSDYFWYPDTPRFDSTGGRDGGYTDDNTELWAAEDGITCFLNYGSNYTQTRSRMDSHPVRCMKE